MKKNTRLLAVLLVLTMLALTFTACASSSKMAAYEQSASEASYDTASWTTSSVEAPAATANEDFKMEEPAEEAEYEEGALATTTAVTQDEAPEAAATDVASNILYSADLSAQTTDRVFSPAMEDPVRQGLLCRWNRAVQRARDWARED